MRLASPEPMTVSTVIPSGSYPDIGAEEYIYDLSLREYFDVTSDNKINIEWVYSIGTGNNLLFGLHCVTQYDIQGDNLLPPDAEIKFALKYAYRNLVKSFHETADLQPPLTIIRNEDLVDLDFYIPPIKKLLAGKTKAV